MTNKIESKEYLAYDDILLSPQYSEIITRHDVDVSSNLFDNYKLTLPIIASPMDSICESEMAKVMHEQGAAGIIHRYNSIEKQISFVKDVGVDKSPIVAIGVSGDYKERFDEFYSIGVRNFCLDVAHGHHITTKKAIKYLKSRHDDLNIIAGTIGTYYGALDLANWGADAIRVGVGSGSICKTRIVTGHGVPTVTSLIEARKGVEVAGKHTRRPTIIADGGIRNSGDIVKAFACGADCVIIGSLLAGTKQTPGRIITDPNSGRQLKCYRGMASTDAQQEWRGYVSVEEGVSTTVPYIGDVTDILCSLKNGICSGLSYSGSKNIKEFYKDVKIIRQTHAGIIESSPHIFNRR